MSLATPIDPALREVLEDVAKQAKPGSLFRGLGPDRIGGAFTLPDQQVSVATAGLTVAERELVRSHREELASVLRGAFLHSVSKERRGLNPVRTLEESDGVSQLGRKAARLGIQVDSMGLPYRVQHYLDRIVDGCVIEGEDDQASLLVASMRLSSIWVGRHFFALSRYVYGRYQEALTHTEPLVDPASPRVAAFAWSLRRATFHRLGLEDLAAESGVFAARLGFRSGQLALARIEAAGALLTAVARGHGFSLESLGRGVSVGDVRLAALQMLDECSAGLGRESSVIQKCRDVLSRG